MSNQKLKMIGKGRTIATYDDGSVEVKEFYNMIVNVGFDFLIQCLTGVGSGGRPNVLSHIAVGSSTTPSSGTMTNLVNEVARGPATISFTPGSKKFTMSTSFARGAITETISETAVFNAPSGGTMLNRLLMATPQPGGENVQITQEFEFEVL